MGQRGRKRRMNGVEVFVSCVLFNSSSATMRASSLLLRAGGEAGAGHAFAQASFVEKVLFEPL